MPLLEQELHILPEHLPKTRFVVYIHRKYRNRQKSSIWVHRAGFDINVCPIPVKTDVGQIYFHWYKILGLLYKRAPFDLQFVHNLFWLKLKWNARSKLCLLYHLSFSMLWWSSRTLTKLKSQSQKCFNERKYQYLKYKNKNHSGTDT